MRITWKCSHCKLVHFTNVKECDYCGFERDENDLSYDVPDDAVFDGCKMCGNEWKKLNKEGFCSSCWTVWKS